MKLVSKTEVLTPPGSWRAPSTHFLKALESPWYGFLLRLNDCVARATTEFWSSRNARVGFLPVTTGAVSSPSGLGSDSVPVPVSIFGKNTFLADSMQFGLEFLCRQSQSGAYYLMPSFRGESVDSTHLHQFFHSEAEVPVDLDGIMVLAEQYVRFLSRAIMDELPSEIETVAGSLDHIYHLENLPSFPRLTFNEAAALLEHDGSCITTDETGQWRTLTRTGERALIQKVGEFLWVTHHDYLSVPFYQADDGHGQALNADLLFGPGEVIGCGERHANYAQTSTALKQHGVNAEPYHWYLAMKQDFPLKTSGFGMGVERYLMWITQQDDIRDFQIFLRDRDLLINP